MGGGPKNVTSTTSNQPPAFLLPGLNAATNASLTDFYGQTGQQPPQQGFQGGGPRGGGPRGEPIGGNGVQQPGQGTAPPLIDQGQNLVSQTLGGNFLNPDTNPYLQQTFDRAADLTQTRLASEFAGSGRDLGAARPARSDELQTLSSNIFGGNFQQERDRQQNALGQAQEFDPTNLLINRISGIIPGAGGSTRSTQPVYSTGLFG